VAIAGEILEYLYGTAEGRFGVDDPIFVAKGFEPTLPCFRVSKVLKAPEKLELVVVEGVLELSDELGSEQSAQDADGQKEPTATAYPTFTVEAQAATRDDAVQMGMEMKILSPGMQQRETAELGAEMFRVSAERQQGFGNASITSTSSFGLVTMESCPASTISRTAHPRFLASAAACAKVGIDDD
jgi:hypothetical protein